MRPAGREPGRVGRLRFWLLRQGSRGQGDRPGTPGRRLKRRARWWPAPTRPPASSRWSTSGLELDPRLCPGPEGNRSVPPGIHRHRASRRSRMGLDPCRKDRLMPTRSCRILALDSDSCSHPVPGRDPGQPGGDPRQLQRPRLLGHDRPRDPLLRRSRAGLDRRRRAGRDPPGALRPPPYPSAS